MEINTWAGLLCTGLLMLGVLAGVAGLVVWLVSRQPRLRARPIVEQRPGRPVPRRSVPPTAVRWCPECGTGLPADAPEGMCPQCLLRGAVSSAREAENSNAAEQTAAYVGPPAPRIEELASLLPQLEIIELIGQGGMGSVYRARQRSLDRLVAVKVLPPEAGRDPAFAERFNREARALARLTHPNIVAVHEIGHVGEFYYIVMEYVDGVNLRQLMRAGHLPPEQALRIVPQICDALQFAHEEGIVHRDIKPENILLDKKGRVKIADFGLAKLLGRDSENFTLTGSRQVMGTLYYMAPEQVERPLEVDHRADIYSLGVVFYEMLTGQLPVGRFPMPSEKAGTDAHLDGIVLHALEREPERRYQHASDVKTDVESSARTPRSLVKEPNADDRESALQQVRGPANALMVMGVLGPVEWLAAVLVTAAIAWGEGPVGRKENLSGTLAFGIVFILNAIVGGFLVAGARKMKRLEAYEFSVISSLMVVLQLLTPTFPISFAVAAWALWILGKQEVRAAFKEQLKYPARASRKAPMAAPPSDEGRASFEGARARIQGPSLLLLITGIGYTAFTLVAGIAAILSFLYIDPPSVATIDHWMMALFSLLPLIAQGLVIIMGALKMRHFESYGWAVAGSTMALVPSSPLAIIGLPVGIWALSVLMAPDVKAAFVGNPDKSAPTD